MELVRLVYGLMCRNDSCMYGCKVAFLMYILIPFCRKCGWLCIFHEEFCEKDKFAYHIVDILRNLLFFMVYLLWTVLCAVVMASVVMLYYALILCARLVSFLFDDLSGYSYPSTFKCF